MAEDYRIREDGNGVFHIQRYGFGAFVINGQLQHSRGWMDEAAEYSLLEDATARIRYLRHTKLTTQRSQETVRIIEV